MSFPVFKNIILSGVSVTSSGNRLLVGPDATLMESDRSGFAITSDLALTGSNLYNSIIALSGSITGGNASPATWIETQIDFGTGKPVYDKTFIITDSSVSSGSKIVVLPCGKTASGQQDGDWLWDGLTLAALPGSGSFTLFSAPIPGPIQGKRIIQYQVTI